MTFENCIVHNLFYFFRKKSLKVTFKKKITRKDKNEKGT